jgi:hypothetical protein
MMNSNMKDALGEVVGDYVPQKDAYDHTLVKVQRRRHTRRLAGLAALAMIGLAAGALVVVSNTGASHQQLGFDTLQIAPGETPFVEGKKLGLTEVLQSVQFHLYRPDSTMASDESLTNVWYAKDTQQVALEYESGIEVILQPEALLCPNCPAASDQFADQAKQLGPPTSVEDVDGVPALVLPRDIAPHTVNGNLVSSGDRGAVILILDGVFVQVSGPFDSPDLLQVAGTLA